MTDFYLYLAKSSLLITVFYLLYRVLLQKETFFKLNRIFLLTGFLVAIILPSLTIREVIYLEVESGLMNVTSESLPESPPMDDSSFSISFISLLTYLYLSGVIFFFLKFLIQLLSLYKVIKRGKKYNLGNFTIVETSIEDAPFSFFNYIVLNPDLISDLDLDTILIHEQAHADQKHSFDVLFVNMLCILQWVNPFAWGYKRSVIENLEYLADASTIKSTNHKKEYQYLMLEQSTKMGVQQLNIINTFNSSIKKRIVMLNKKHSKKNQLWKYSLMFPVLTLFMTTINTRTVAQVKTNNSENDIIIIVDKNSTDEYLAQQVKLTKQKTGIDLKFFNVQRNSTGEIIYIRSKYESKETKGSFSSNSKNTVIQPFKFFAYKEVNHFTSGYGPAKNMSRTFMVTRKTSDEKLEYFIKTFKEKYGGNLVFDNIKRNKEGYITTISSRFEGPNNFKGKHNLTGTTPIGYLALSINYDDDENLIEINYSSEYGTKQKITPSLIVVNGKEQTNYDTKNSSPNEIKSINVLSNEEARKKYGTKGKDGAIEITTKSENADKAVILSEKSKKKPLIILDGQVQKKDFNLEDLAPDEIANIEILRNKSATSVYGEKGKNGAILITTKKAKAKKQEK